MDNVETFPTPVRGLKETLVKYLISLTLLPLAVSTIWSGTVTWNGITESAYGWVKRRLKTFAVVTGEIKEQNEMKLALLSKNTRAGDDLDTDRDQYFVGVRKDGQPELLNTRSHGTREASDRHLFEGQLFRPGLGEFRGNLVYVSTLDLVGNARYSKLAVLTPLDDSFLEDLSRLTSSEISLFLGDRLVATTWRDLSGQRVLPQLDPETKIKLSRLARGQILDGRAKYVVPHYRGIYAGESKLPLNRDESEFYAFHSFEPLVSSKGKIIGFISIVVPEDVLMRGLKRAIYGSLFIFLILSLLSILFVTKVANTRIANRFINPLRQAAQEINELATGLAIAGTMTTKPPSPAYPLPPPENEVGVLKLSIFRLRQTLKAAEETFARTSQFSADIAHELRTPLNNVRGEVEIALAKERSPGEYREALGSCLDETDRMAQLIDRLLFLARAEMPETRIQRKQVDVAGELAKIAEFHEVNASEKGVRIVLECAGGLTADLDQTLFQRAVSNLVTNALEHTPSGGQVKLSGASGPSGAGLRIEVADTGCGISPEHLPYVFDRFYRADNSRTTSSKNLGLGLSIVKSITRLHGGEVEIESNPAQGTRVVLLFS